MCTHYVRPFFLAARASARGGHWFAPGYTNNPRTYHPRIPNHLCAILGSNQRGEEFSERARHQSGLPAPSYQPGGIFRAREAPINLSLAEGVSPRRSLVRPPGTQKIPGLTIRGFHTCARYWDRTSDLFRVREARYRCANRAQHYDVVRGEDGIRTRVHGFAGRCLTTRPPHRISLCERWGSEL